MFRRLAAIVITFAAPAVGVVWTLGLMGWVGEKVNAVNNILPALIFIIGFADAVHLLLDFRRSRMAGVDRQSAAANAIRHLGLACLLTSGTTAVGFGSLAMARTYSVQRFGIACVWGSTCAFFAVMLVVPLLALTPLGDLVSLRQSPDGRKHGHRIARLTDHVFAYPWLITIVGTCLSLGLFLPTLRLQPDIQFSEAIPSDSETAQTIQLCDEKFGGALQPMVVIEWPADQTLRSPQVLEVAAEVHRLIEQQPVSRAAGIACWICWRCCRDRART